jgi:glycerate 2-kinase
MRVLVAFDKFKDSLNAGEACEIAAAALGRVHRDWTIDVCPLADGGEGFCEILTRAVGGELHERDVTGPRGAKIAARFGLVRRDKISAAALDRLTLGASDRSTAPNETTVAIVEMAVASGLALLLAEQRDPWQTTTFGTGELLRAAAESGAAAIVLGVGGSATHDLGLGALAALGLEFRTANNESVALPIPVVWPKIQRLQGKLVAPPPIFIACDVVNPLLGSRGAAAVYGPQKGLRAADVARLDHETARLALMLCAQSGRPDSLMDAPGAGAAGGIAFGLMAATGARLLPGFDFVSAWLDLDRRIAAADVVVTGEGRFDETSLAGKGPGAIAARAMQQGKPVHVFAGAIGAGVASARHENPDTTKTGGRLELHPISPADMPLAEALRSSRTNLAATVERVFALAR